MVAFKKPQINLYSQDLPRAITFYSSIGFEERCRTPATGDPAHMELVLDGFTLGIATFDAARVDHGLSPGGSGRWIEVVLWTDNADEAQETLVEKGATLLSPAHDFLGGKLRSAWVADPDGNPIQLVQQND